MKKHIYAAGFVLGLLAATSAKAETVQVEWYTISIFGKYITDGYKSPIDVYADGKKVATDIKCNRADPCQVEVGNSKHITLCRDGSISDCGSVNISNTSKPRIALVLTARGLWPITSVVGPEGMSFIDERVKEQESE